jgi:hypothetical protein
MQPRFGCAELLLACHHRRRQDEESTAEANFSNAA